MRNICNDLIKDLFTTLHVDNVHVRVCTLIQLGCMLTFLHPWLFFHSFRKWCIF